MTTSILTQSIKSHFERSTSFGFNFNNSTFNWSYRQNSLQSELQSINQCIFNVTRQERRKSLLTKDGDIIVLFHSIQKCDTGCAIYLRLFFFWNRIFFLIFWCDGKYKKRPFACNWAEGDHLHHFIFHLWTEWVSID